MANPEKPKPKQITLPDSPTHDTFAFPNWAKMLEWFGPELNTEDVKLEYRDQVLDGETFFTLPDGRVLRSFELRDDKSVFSKDDPTIQFLPDRGLLQNGKPLDAIVTMKKMFPSREVHWAAYLQHTPEKDLKKELEILRRDRASNSLQRNDLSFPLEIVGEAIASANGLNTLIQKEQYEDALVLIERVNTLLKKHKYDTQYPTLGIRNADGKIDENELLYWFTRMQSDFESWGERAMKLNLTDKELSKKMFDIEQRLEEMGAKIDKPGLRIRVLSDDE